MAQYSNNRYTHNYNTGKKIIGLLLFFILIIVACHNTEDVPYPGKAEQMLKVQMASQGSGINQNTLANMRLFTFYSNTKLYEQELLNIENNSGVLSCNIKTGKWHMTMVSASDNFNVYPINTSQKAKDILMYEYTPLVVNNRSENAPELMMQFIDIPQVTVDAVTNIKANIVRNVAKIRVSVNEIIGDINLSSPDNKIRIHYVPNKLSYTGQFLPDITNPDTLLVPVCAPLILTKTSGTISSGAISFIIPANRGDLIGSTTTHKMDISVELKKNNGTLFKGRREIPLVAKCNEQLHVNLKVNAGMDIEASIYPWVGSEYEIALPGTGIKLEKAEVSMAGEVTKPEEYKPMEYKKV